MSLLASTPLLADRIAGHARAEYMHSFELPLPPADAFVFFAPVGEKRWATDWQPVFASAPDADLHNGSVFTVDRPNPEGGTPIESVWTITRYEPPHTIEYHNVLPGLRTTRITVSVAQITPDRTRVTVRYVYTGLTSKGDDAIRQITPEGYRQMIESWGAEIDAYLGRGTPASP